MKRASIVIAALAVVAALPFLYTASFVYGQVENTTDVFRVNRFTGQKQFASEFGWVTLEELGNKMQARDEQSKAAFKKTLSEVVELGKKGEVRDATWNGVQLGAKTLQGREIRAEVSAAPILHSEFGNDVRAQLEAAGIKVHEREPFLSLK
jgi:hypothetical protein